MEVRVLFWAPNTKSRCMQMQRLFRFPSAFFPSAHFLEKVQQLAWVLVFPLYNLITLKAQVAELVDALVSGTSE